MALDSELLDLFIHTVTLKPFTGKDVDAKPSYGTATTPKAKIVLKTRYLRASDGREIVGRGTLYLDVTTVPSAKDELTMPTGFEPLKPPILDVRPHYDTQGLHHVELIIG